MSWIFPLHGPRNPRTCALATLLATAISLPLGAIVGGGIPWVLFQDLEQAKTVAYWTGPICAGFTFLFVGSRLKDQGAPTLMSYLRLTGGAAFSIGMVMLWACGSYKVVYLATPVAQAKVASLDPTYIATDETRRAGALGITIVLWIMFFIGSMYVAWFRGGVQAGTVRGERVDSRLSVFQRIRAGFSRKAKAPPKSKEQKRVDYLLDKSNMLGGIKNLSPKEQQDLRQLSVIIKEQLRKPGSKD